MKKITLFQRFDLQGFLKDKKLTLVSVVPVHSDYFDGLKATVVITDDNTDYNGVSGLNLYEKFTVKISGASDEKAFEYKLNQPVRIVNYTKASIWKPDDSFEYQLTVEGTIAQ